MHTIILQMSCPTNKFGVPYCFFSRNNKRWKVHDSFNWLIHEKLVDFKACSVQMGDFTKVNRFLGLEVPLLAFNLTFKS